MKATIFTNLYNFLYFSIYRLRSSSSYFLVNGYVKIDEREMALAKIYLFNLFSTRWFS